MLFGTIHARRCKEGHLSSARYAQPDIQPGLRNSAEPVNFTLAAMNTSVGYIYILTNKYVPGLVKVGFTNRDPHTRADELSNVTGVPGKWKVFHSWKLEDAYEAEQEIFSDLNRYHETGEFLKLQPDDAIEKISVVLAAKGRIGSDGLSPIVRQEADRLRKEQLLRREQEELKRLFTQIDKELRDAAKQASNELFEKKLPQMKQNQIRNAFVWGGGAFLVALAFVPKVEGAFLLAGIFALFAYFMGDGWPEISNSDQAKHARTEAITHKSVI